MGIAAGRRQVPKLPLLGRGSRTLRDLSHSRADSRARRARAHRSAVAADAGGRLVRALDAAAHVDVMNKVRSINFSPDEWLAATVSLTVVEKGCYWTVCALIYAHGGPVDDDPLWIAKNCGCDPRTWKAARRRLLSSGKLVRIEPPISGANGIPACGQLTNSRCEQELNKSRERMFRARSAADLSRSRRDLFQSGVVNRGRSRT